jgi:hypothetical protein
MLGRRMLPQDIVLKAEGDCTVYKPSGERLLTLRRAAVNREAADAAYPFLHWLRNRKTNNRGHFGASGRNKRVLASGQLSRTNIGGQPVASAVVGSSDRYARIPYCRACAASMERPEEWAACFPYVQQVARVFESVAPDRYAAQMVAAAKTHPAYVVPGTPFTTLTVNNTFAGGCHRDAGDLPEGFGIISVLRQGSYRGGELVFPRFGVAVDLQDRDVIAFDPHEVHGNTPIHGAVGPAGDPDHGGHERISVVFYFRTGMLDCLSPAEERERAKNLRGALGGPLEEDEEDEPQVVEPEESDA